MATFGRTGLRSSVKLFAQAVLAAVFGIRRVVESGFGAAWLALMRCGSLCGLGLVRR